MNTITNNVISKITHLEKAIEKSKTQLDKYQSMVDELQKYAKTRYDQTFVISHVTINYLRGHIKTLEGKRDILKDCLNYEERQLLKEQMKIEEAK